MILALAKVVEIVSAPSRARTAGDDSLLSK